MYRFHKVILSLIIGAYASVPLHIFAQQAPVTMAIQQGHANNIQNIAISKDLKFFATFGLDKKIVLWDYRTGSQIAFNYLSFTPVALTFGENSDQLFLKTFASEVLVLDIHSMQVLTAPDSVNVPFRSKRIAAASEHNAVINEAKINLILATSGQVLATKTTDYFDQPFNSVVYSKTRNCFYAGCEDGHIYIFNNKLKLIHQLKGHNSGVNDLEFTKDEMYLFSVSSDRSIIKWDANTQEITSRHTGKNFPLYGLSLNNSGTKIMFGDEIGYLKTLNINNSRLEIQSFRNQLYPITHTIQFNDSQYLYAGEDNKLRLIHGKKIENIRNIRIGPKPIIHTIFTKKLNLYQPSYSNYYHISINQSKKSLGYFALRKKFIPKYLRIADVSNPNRIRFSPKLYIKGHNGNSRLVFINDSTLISNKNQSELMVWKIQHNNVKKVWYKPLKLDNYLNQIVKFNSQIIAGINQSNLCMYNLYDSSWICENVKNIRNSFELSDGIIGISDEQNRFYTVTKDHNSMVISQAFEGHLDSITHLQYLSSRNLIFSSSIDGTIRIWNYEKHKLIVTIIPVGSSDYVAVTPDNYYMLSNKHVQSFGFKMGNKFFLPEQFDPFYNRPDIVLDRLGYAEPELIDAYHKAYIKRIQKIGFTEEMLNSDFHLPEIEIENQDQVPSVSTNDSVRFVINMRDSKYLLDRYNVWINNVPLHGMQGLSLRSDSIQQKTISVVVKLAAGKNKIQVSCMNQKGAESYKATMPVLFEPKQKINPTMHFIGIGIDHYKQSGKDLKYSVKDIRDLAAILKKEYGNNISIDTIFDKNVNRKRILEMKTKLLQSNVNDKVIIAFSGHGLLDSNYDYFLSTHEVDFENPQIKGLPYGDLEWLLDSIPPRKKLLLIDACHSGEIDKSELVDFIDTIGAVADNDQDKGSKIHNKKMRQGSLGLKNSFQLMQDLFVNISKGCGASVISAAGGDQAALEGDKLKNGYFTYAILQLLNTSNPVSVNQLKAYVFKEVERLSGGRQQPTSRSENLDVDWNVIE